MQHRMRRMARLSGARAWLAASGGIVLLVLTPLGALGVAAVGDSSAPWADLIAYVLPVAVRDTLTLLVGVGLISAAIGTVTNLAARLCDEARGDQILVSQRVHSAVEALVETEMVGELSLKGFSRPLPVYNIIGPKETPDNQHQPSSSR